MKNKRIRFPGFTLVELLVAMTITLLMMAALAKSFTVIGESMKSGRSRVSLSSKLRSVSFRVRTDLRTRTVDARPPISSQSGQGYFMYYEGPLTDSTFGLYGAEPIRTTPNGEVLKPTDPRYFDPAVKKGPTYRKHGRIGDFDDYIAFTAEAPGDEWFTGKVPAYLVNDSAADPMEPTVIRSKYAEIIIWATPKWQVDPATKNLQLAPHPSGMPLYQDGDNDLVPDSIVLHQRILLIRPDLNVRRTIPLAGNLAFNDTVLRPLLGNVNPYVVPPALQRLYPIGAVNNSTGSPPTPFFGSYAVGGSATDNRLMLNSSWLVGMTPLHHFFDLSLRRVIHPSTGDPTGYVAANSLQDLVQPHNRFAHVRYPGRYFGRGSFSGGDNATSMPLLALGWNDAILRWQTPSDALSILATDPRTEVATGTAPPWFPTRHPSPTTLNAAGNSRSGLFNGWLLPHFELGDPNPAGSSDADHWQRGYLTTADARWDRTGEDIMATNILAFDLKGYDPTAPVFVTSGLDGQPGSVGVNDDGVGGADTSFAIALTSGGGVSTELGTIGTDDQLVEVSDPGMYALMGQAILDPSNSLTYGVDLQALSTQGTFVDLLYPYLAGSPLRERTAATGIISTPPNSGATTITRVATNYNAFMQSDLSLFPIPPSGMNTLKRSGKLVHSDTSGNIVFLQPTYDTWTDGYETDGFDQSHTLSGALTGAKFGTTWVLNNITGLRPTPRLGSQPAMQVDTGTLIPTDPETSAPFAAPLPAISLTVRVIDPQTEEMLQFTIIETMD